MNFTDELVAAIAEFEKSLSHCYMSLDDMIYVVGEICLSEHPDYVETFKRTYLEPTMENQGVFIRAAEDLRRSYKEMLKIPQ